MLRHDIDCCEIEFELGVHVADLDTIFAGAVALEVCRIGCLVDLVACVVWHVFASVLVTALCNRACFMLVNSRTIRTPVVQCKVVGERVTNSLVVYAEASVDVVTYGEGVKQMKKVTTM